MKLDSAEMQSHLWRYVMLLKKLYNDAIHLPSCHHMAGQKPVALSWQTSGSSAAQLQYLATFFTQKHGVDSQVSAVGI